MNDFLQNMILPEYEFLILTKHKFLDIEKNVYYNNPSRRSKNE